MTRVIHTGDTHLGYRQYHRPERRSDFLDAFRRVVDDAIADDVDAVVHAGDLFHDRQPDLPDILGTLSVLRDLDDADVPFLAVVGNHEGKRDAQWLDLFESLGLATRLDAAPTVVGDTAFYGLDFVPRSQRDDLDYEFESHDADHAALVSHGLFEPFDYADWDTERLLTESTVDFDALLLGDNHKPQKTQLTETWVTYCGSTERASASEREDRGYNIVTFEDDVQITRRGLDTREFVFVDVELEREEGLERVRSQIGQHDLDGAVVIVGIDGDGDPIAPASIEEYALDEGALVARVTDHRELASDERETSVSFADPDEAVTERVRELGLSGAARDIDETVRASKLADANVADTVEERIRTLVEDNPEELTVSRDASGETEASDPTPESSDGTEQIVSPNQTSTAATSESDGGEPAATGDAASTPDSDDVGEATDADSDGQSNMGDFL